MKGMAESSEVSGLGQGLDRSGVLIEPGSLSDLEAILRIEQASFSTPWTRKMVQAELEGNPFAYFLLGRKTQNGDILGYICFWIVFEELRLMNVAVEPTVRRQGIARALVGRALRIGGDRGAGRAVLEVRASNTPAYALYDQLGFRQISLRAGYYAGPVEDAILMEREPLF